MLERSYQTRQGTIRYWVSAPGPRGTALVFLPGLTADHRLFQMQFSFFASRRPLLVWDAPGHGASRPFALDFSLMEQAEWLLLQKAVDDIANGRICAVNGKVKHTNNEN